MLASGVDLSTGDALDAPGELLAALALRPLEPPEVTLMSGPHLAV